jgi:hypothetical protein
MLALRWIKRRNSSSRCLGAGSLGTGRIGARGDEGRLLIWSRDKA